MHALVIVNVNVPTKFELPICMPIHSKDTIGPQNLTSGQSNLT